MPDTLLTSRVLNRALLDRQLLLERSTVPVQEAVERVGGLQTQYAPSAYIGLWSRLSDFEREELTRALVERRVVQATLMRSTIHVVSAADYPLLTAGIRRSRREWWESVQRGGLKDVDMPAAARVVGAALKDGPRTQAELVRELAAAGFGKVAWSGAGAFVDLVRVPPSGTWERRRADTYALADGWLAASSASEEDGIEHLVRRYVGAFGPAALADIGSWAQLPVTLLKPAVERLGLVRYRDEGGRQLFDLPEATLPAPDTPAPVRLLPTWDATLLVHARRAAILPERHRPIVFSTRLPFSMPTFLVDGAVAGSWRYADGRVTVEPFEKLTRAQRDDVDAEAERIRAWH